jgi:hypothetical protein
MNNPRDLLRAYRALPPLAVPMQTEVRSDGGMKLHMLQAPWWNVNPGAKSILRWSGMVTVNALPALRRALVMPDSQTGLSPERNINDWITQLTPPGYYLGTFVTKPSAPHGSYGQQVPVQALFTTQGDPNSALNAINQAILTGAPTPVAGILTTLLTTYCNKQDQTPWVVQHSGFDGPGVASIIGWSGVLVSSNDLADLTQYLGTKPSGTGPLPEQLINNALESLLVGYYLGTFVDSTTNFPANVRVLFGLKSNLRSDEVLGNPNGLTDDEYNLRTVLQTMSDTVQSFPDALAALKGLLKNFGSSVDTPDPPLFMLSQMDVRAIDPTAP